MEQLVQQIREAVASQGPQWLMKIAEEFGTAAAAVPEVRAEEEPPAESSGAEPRGRPQRRRQPPTRLSPSPAAKKGGRSSPRAAGACGSGAARSQRPADAARRGDRRSGVAMGPEAGGTLTRSGGAVQRSDNRYAARNIRHNLASSAGRASSAQSQRSRGVTHELGSERHAGQRRDRTSTPPGPSFLMAGPGRNKADVEIQGASPDGGRRGGSNWTVWVLGHSYIYWAENRARARPMGAHLGQMDVCVQWHGIRGLKWTGLLHEVLQVSRRSPDRVVLVIHAGGNDLGKMKVGELLTLMKEDLCRFKKFFNKVILVWSDIVARRFWREARDMEAIERARRNVNFKMSRFVQSIGGVAIRHWELEKREIGMFRGDGVHLSDIGTDTFLSGLQDGVEEALWLACGGRSAV
ncbi:uncharacterized protein [Eleutherodactylus coqui]|uniref:uncharacterized protein isoform X2 n=1 Tax=Eleutherodactylus coqui TaxID=57060 RepID=UPI0034621E0B